MREDPVLAQILARLDAIKAGQTDPDDLLDSMDVDAVRDHIERIVLARRELDVPLHQRGFGVMEEPPHQPSPGPDRRH